MLHSTFTALRSISASFALVAVTVGAASAQPVPANSPQSAVLASGLRRAFASAQAPATAGTQGTPSSTSDPDDGWKVGLYPIFVWLPLGIDIDVTVPPDENGVGGGSGQIVDGRLDGAYLGGFYASKGLFRVDADGVWAAFGGDRPERPFLQVDADVIYFHVTGGVRLVGDLYAIGGVRRLALDYTVKLADRPTFERKPGVWDPLVGVAWHTDGRRLLEVHTVFEVGGFGVGSDTEVSGSARVDFKPVKHFGITAGYSFLYFKVEDTLRNRTFTVKQTLHGPLFGIGLYF